MPKILVIDDDHALFDLLKEYLEDEGFSCFHAADSVAALEQLVFDSWDLAILDVMLPGMSGFGVLARLRSDPETASLPVLMLTARGEEEAKVKGLENGADDYLTKPFSPRELLARIKALLRRATPSAATTVPAGEQFTLGDVSVNRNSLTAAVGEDEVKLSGLELRLLEAFAESQGGVVERPLLYERIFNHRPFPGDRSLDMLVSRLRRKLGPRPGGGDRIRAIRGEGYLLVPPGGAE